MAPPPRRRRLHRARAEGPGVVIGRHPRVGVNGPAARARVSSVAQRVAASLPGHAGRLPGGAGRVQRARGPVAVPRRRSRLPCDTVRLVFSRVTSGEADHGVVPLENSQAGSVNETYEQLQHTSLLRIVGEVLVRVDHALLGVPGARLEEIRRAHSHWQALAQCEEFLSSMHIAPVPVHDTAGAARMIASEWRPRGRRHREHRSRDRPGPRGARRADPDREGELHEVRRHLDRRGRSRSTRQDLARHGGAGPPGIAAGVAAAVRRARDQPPQAGIAPPPRQALRVRLLRGPHGGGRLARGRERARRGGRAHVAAASARQLRVGRRARSEPRVGAPPIRWPTCPTPAPRLASHGGWSRSPSG